jgi:hypothetical protein
MNHHRAFAVLIAAALLLPGRADADPSDADRVKARELATKAHQAVDAKDYAAAANLFTQAYALVPAPTMLLGLARARRELGQLVAAKDAYDRILRKDLPADAPKPFFEAQDFARKDVAALAPRIAQVKVTVTGGTNVKATLDGVEVPIGELRPVDPGQHAVSVTDAGDASATATVTVGEGKTEEVTLVPKAAAVPAAVVLRVPESKSSTRKTAGIVSLSLGGAGLVLGGVMGGLVLNLHGTLADGCPNGRCPASLVPKLDSYNTFGLVSTIGFIAGGAAAGLGVVLLVTAPKNDGATVGLMTSPTHGGGVLGAAGRF